MVLKFQNDNLNILIRQKSFNLLKEEIQEYLKRYNEEKKDLPVLFDDDIYDINRNLRIISKICSHVLLVVVGGSGKQSISRLGCFIKEIDITLPNLISTKYNKKSLLHDKRSIMIKSVLKTE